MGRIVGAHGVRGEVKVRAFTAEPHDVAAYGPVQDDDGGRRFTLSTRGAAKDGVVIALVAGVASREAAEALKGLRLYVDRAALPPPDEDEVYAADLVGLAVETVAGTRFGVVRGLVNYGAGDLLEIAPAGKAETVLAPFTRAAVPVVDVAAGRVVIDPASALPVDGPAVDREEAAS